MSEDVNIKNTVNLAAITRYWDWIESNRRYMFDPNDYTRELRAKYDRIAVKIEPLLNAAQKRCRERTISVDTIAKELLYVEHHLGIPKKTLEGVQVRVDACAQDFPRAYQRKGAPTSTVFYAVFHAGSWRLLKIERTYCGSANDTYRVTLTDAAKAAILKNFERW